MMPLQSGPDEPRDMPTDPDILLEAAIPIDPEAVSGGAIAIHSQVAVELGTTEDDGVSRASVDVMLYSTSATPSGLGSETKLASLPDGSLNSQEASSQDESREETSDRGPPGEESTSTNGNFELGKNTVVLCTNSIAPEGQCTVYIVGTAHVSQESCNEVQALIRHVKPQVVFLELCDSRIAMLMPQKLKVPTFEEMVHMYRNKGMNLFGIIYSWFLAKVADKLEVFPGAEFRVACAEAIACGARLSFGDRPVQITLRRTWTRMSSWHKTKLIFSMIFQGVFMPSPEELSEMVEQMKDTDMLTALIQELSKTFPSLMDTLVHERDLYMAAVLRGVSQNFSTVVAVVGKGHLRGITQNWGKDISLEELLTVPKKKSFGFSRPVVWWGIAAVAVGGLAIYAGMQFSQRS